MNQGTAPNRMDPGKRIQDVASILATGILRMRKRDMNQKTNNRSFSDSGLDVSVEKSVHCTSKSLSKGESR